MKNKNFVHSLLLMLFAVGSGSYILLSKRGITEYLALRKELQSELDHVHSMEKTYEYLQAHAQAWEEGLFEIEKSARQDLQMGYTNELLYYFPHEHVGTHTIQTLAKNTVDTKIA